MENIYYLKSGEACQLKEKIGDRFIVNKLFSYEDHEGDLCEVLSDTDTIVDEIYPSPLVSVIAEEISQLKIDKKAVEKELRDKETQLRLIKFDIAKETSTLVNNKNFIINKTEFLNAKRLVLFEQGRVMPIDSANRNNNMRGLKLSFEIKLSEKQENAWGYKIYDDALSSGNYLCPKYGYMINPTDEEVEERIWLRLKELEFNDWIISTVDDKYLNEAQKLIKKNYRKTSLEKELAEKSKAIEDYSKRVEAIKQELN